jgi:uncharacterized protein (TIGR00730 family)
MPQAISVCVYCGSRDGARPEHVASARALGGLIAAEGWRLVYGAGDVGLMGAVAAATQAAGGDTLGVIPVHLMQREKPRETLSTLIVTENMHERKKVMFMNADAIVVLPGGAGTLDEFFEVLTWRQIGLHTKPIFLLNSGGYWNALARLLETVVVEGFAEPSLLGYATVVPDVSTLSQELRARLSRRSASAE